MININNINILEYVFNNVNKVSIYKINNEINNIKFNINYNNEVNKWNSHKKIISTIDKFKANGVLTYTDGIKKLFIRFYIDNKNHNKYKFIGYNFFGFKLVELILNNNKFFIKKRGDIKYLEENYQDLFKLFKINIPIKNIGLWLLGLPGNSNNFTLNKNGKLDQIKYMTNSQEYIIKYHKYSSLNPFLPINIELNQGKNNINLKINKWMLFK